MILQKTKIFWETTTKSFGFMLLLITTVFKLANKKINGLSTNTRDVLRDVKIAWFFTRITCVRQKIMMEIPIAKQPMATHGLRRSPEAK